MSRYCVRPVIQFLFPSPVSIDPLLVLIEYVPYGDLLGYLRKSRGLNDTYFKDPDVKPQTSLTAEQLMRFAWQVADGMLYLSSRKVWLLRFNCNFIIHRVNCLCGGAVVSALASGSSGWPGIVCCVPVSLGKTLYSHSCYPAV